jgi:hypothetical protein
VLTLRKYTRGASVILPARLRRLRRWRLVGAGVCYSDY